MAKEPYIPQGGAVDDWPEFRETRMSADEEMAHIHDSGAMDLDVMRRQCRQALKRRRGGTATVAVKGFGPGRKWKPGLYRMDPKTGTLVKAR